jgi:PAS domain S-box-containing protein
MVVVMAFGSGRARSAARLAALFIFAAGVFTFLSNSGLGLEHVLRPAFITIALLDLALAAVVWHLPWSRLPTWTIFGFVPLAFVRIGLLHAVGAAPLITHPIFFILLFIWVGLSLPPRTSLALLPLTATTYVLPLCWRGLNTASLESALVAVSVCTLVGEVIARIMQQLYTTQDRLEQEVAERTATLHATNTALQRELVERRQIAAALAAEHAKFELVVKRAPVGILLVDAQRTITLANPAMARLLGVADAGALLGQDLLTVVAPEQREHCAALVGGVFANLVQITGVESVLLHADAERVIVELDIAQFLWEGRVAAQLIVHDTTERKQVEAQLRRQVDRLAALRAIDLAITTSPDLQTTLTVILEQVTAQLSVDAAHVLLFNPQSQVLEYAAGKGSNPEAFQHTPIQLGRDFAGRVAQDRRLLHIPNIAETTDIRCALLLASEGFVAYYGVPLVTKMQLQGVLEIFQRAPLAPEPSWLNFLEALAGQAAIALDNAALFERLERSNHELMRAYDTTIEGWSRALDLRDKETEGHTRRVTELTMRLTQAMGMSEGELVHVRRGALLHDIGKMGVPDAILLKPGPLDEDEWVIMRRHPVYAYQMLLPIAYLQEALDIPYCHHEKWDGSGYPRGLKGEQIPLAARIFAVVDVWDAMRSDRPYRKGHSAAETREYIRSLAGTHFDPEVVRVFLELLDTAKE